MSRVDPYKRAAKGLQVLAADAFGETPSYQNCHNLARAHLLKVSHPGQTIEEATVALFALVKEGLRPKGRPESKGKAT